MNHWVVEKVRRKWFVEVESSFGHEAIPRKRRLYNQFAWYSASGRTDWNGNTNAPGEEPGGTVWIICSRYAADALKHWIIVVILITIQSAGNSLRVE